MFKKVFGFLMRIVLIPNSCKKLWNAISKYCEENGKSYTFINDDEVEINGKRYEIYRVRKMVVG